jgi:hypothetical protein
MAFIYVESFELFLEFFELCRKGFNLLCERLNLLLKRADAISFIFTTSRSQWCDLFRRGFNVGLTGEQVHEPRIFLPRLPR